MATEVSTRILCDVCNRDDVKREGTRYVFRVGAKAYEFDACEEHGAPVADCLKILEEYGRRPDVTTLAAPVRQAPREECPKCHEEYSGVASLSSHLRRMHGVTLASVRGEPEPYACPICSKRFSRPQSLTLHLKAHEGRGETVPEARARRRKAGRAT